MPHISDERLFAYLTMLESLRDGADPAVAASDFADVAEHLSDCLECETRLNDALVGIASMYAAIRSSHALHTVPATVQEAEPVLTPASSGSAAALSDAPRPLACPIRRRGNGTMVVLGPIGDGQQRISGLIGLGNGDGMVRVECGLTTSPKPRSMIGVGVPLIVLVGVGIVATSITLRGSLSSARPFAQTDAPAVSVEPQQPSCLARQTDNTSGRLTTVTNSPMALPASEASGMVDRGTAVAPLASLLPMPPDRRLFGTIVFQEGSNGLSPQSKLTVAKIAKAALAAPGNVLIEGYSSASPVRKSAFRDNHQLSQARADAVKKALMGNGVPEDRIISSGMGEATRLESTSHCMRADIFLSDPSTVSNQIISDAGTDDSGQ